MAIVSVICPVFGTPAGTGVGSGGGDRDGDSGGEHLGILGVAELLVDGDEAHRVAEPLGITDRVDAGERRHDHRVGEGEHGAVVELDLAVAHFLDHGIRRP